MKSPQLTVRERMLESLAVDGPADALTLKDRICASAAAVGYQRQQMLIAGEIHVVDWVRAGKRRYRSIVAHGPGASVPYPRLNDADAERLRLERNLQRNEARRQEHSANRSRFIRAPRSVFELASCFKSSSTPGVSA